MDTSEEQSHIVPTISKALLRYMNTTWPNKTPSKSMTDKEIAYSIGHREVILKLEAEYELQNKTI